MAPRAVGALFALVAALAFAIALAGGVVPKTVPGWWDGHPILEGKVLERKEIHVGLIEADGCNIQKAGTECRKLETGHTLDVVGFAEIGALALGLVTGILAFFSIKAVGDRRQFLSKLLLFEVVLIGGGAGAIFFHGPDLHIEQRVAMPVGLGFFSVMAGCGLGFIAGVIGMRVRREPLRLKPSEPRMPVPHHPPQPAFDVRELLTPQQQPMRVSHPHMMPPSPGGPLPGPSGPLTPMSAQQNPNPLFESAPQLRPLYDMHNQGAAPNPMAPVLPQRPPTPIPRDQIDARFGMQPPPLEVPTPATHGPMPDQLAGDSASFHPPVNVYPPVAERPVAQRPIDQTEDLERPSDPNFVSPFAPPRPPKPTAPPPPRKNPTIATAVPPMPSMVPEDNQRTSVEVDHSRGRPSELDMAMTVPLEKHSSSSFDIDSSRFAEPLPVRGNPTEENQLVGDSTSQSSISEHTGENFDEALTREPAKYDPVVPPPAPARLEDTPSQLGVAETQLAQFDGVTAATGESMPAFPDPESSPVIAPPAPPPLPRAKPTAPPPLPNSAAPRSTPLPSNLRAQSEAPTTSADVDRAAKERVTKARAHSEQPTAAARGTGQKAALEAATVGGRANGAASPRVTSGNRTTSSVANEAATVAAPMSANEALAAASVQTPEAPTPTSSKWGSPDDASEPKKKSGPPKPWGAPATDPGERAKADREPSGPKQQRIADAPSGPPKPWGANPNEAATRTNDNGDPAATATGGPSTDKDSAPPKPWGASPNDGATVQGGAGGPKPWGANPNANDGATAQGGPPKPWGANPNDGATVQGGATAQGGPPKSWGAAEAGGGSRPDAGGTMPKPWGAPVAEAGGGSRPNAGGTMPKPWGTPAEADDKPLENPTAPSYQPAPSSSPGDGPARIGVPNIPSSRAPLPQPRLGRPSVPPPATKLPTFAKPSSLVPSNGIGKPPSNEQPSATANKASTTTTPSPFATIPSPFGPGGKVPTIPPPVAPLPPLPSIAIPKTQTQPLGDKPTEAAGFHEQPTQAPRKHERPSTDDVIEPPTYAVRSNPNVPIDSDSHPEVGGEIERRSDRSLDPSTNKSGISVDEPISRPSGDLADPPTYHSPEAPAMPRATFPVRNSEAPTRAVGGSGQTNLDVAARQVLQQRAPSELPTRAVGAGGATGAKPRAISTAAPDLAPPVEQAESNGPSPACPQCESPMAWVEQHLRFYCASCRMYF
ncbi:MAG: hypothetical protein QM831_14300 [Kofleriaceae bacterium]